jgi:hypothetical protein
LNPNIPEVSLSKTIVNNVVAGNMDLSFEKQITYLGSSDSLVPNFALASFMRNIGGYKKEHNRVSNSDERTIMLLLILSRIFMLIY